MSDVAWVLLGFSIVHVVETFYFGLRSDYWRTAFQEERDAHTDSVENCKKSVDDFSLRLCKLELCEKGEIVFRKVEQ